MGDATLFFNSTPTTEIVTLPLHGALPICVVVERRERGRRGVGRRLLGRARAGDDRRDGVVHEDTAQRQLRERRSEEHTSELQSRQYLVCRLLLEKKKHRAPVISSAQSVSS